jgi:hypothetical protein
MVVRNPLQEIVDACQCFQPGDDREFTHIVKLCLDLKVVSPLEFRDALAIGSSTILGWADGSLMPLAFMQKNAVTLIRNRIGAHI